MLWEEQRAKDMELYPVVEPIINYTKDRLNYYGTGTHKVASDLTLFAKNKARRMLEGEDPVVTATDSEVKDGAAGDAAGLDKVVEK